VFGDSNCFGKNPEHIMDHECWQEGAGCNSFLGDVVLLWKVELERKRKEGEGVRPADV
jgi:hypothetical protein